MPTIELSVTQYCKKHKIARHSVHRRIKKYKKTKESVNNIIGVSRVGTKIIVLTVDTSIRFKKK